MKSLDRRLRRLEVSSYDDCSFDNPEVLARAVTAINEIHVRTKAKKNDITGQENIEAGAHKW